MCVFIKRPRSMFARRALTDLQDDIRARGSKIEKAVQQREAKKAVRHDQTQAQQAQMQAAIQGLTTTMNTFSERLLEGFGTLIENIKRRP